MGTRLPTCGATVVLNVLLVESDEAEATLLRADLDHDESGIRFSWAHASTVREAVDGLVGRPDVALLHVARGADNELLALRAGLPDTPVVAVIDAWDPGRAQALVTAGATDVFVRGLEPPQCMARRLWVAMARVSSRVVWNV